MKKYYYNKRLHRVIRGDLQIVLFSKLKQTNPQKTVLNIFVKILLFLFSAEKP